MNQAVELVPWHLVFERLRDARTESERCADLVNAVTLFPVPGNDAGANAGHALAALVDACDGALGSEPTVADLTETLAANRATVLGAATDADRTAFRRSRLAFNTVVGQGAFGLAFAPPIQAVLST